MELALIGFDDSNILRLDTELPPTSMFTQACSLNLLLFSSIDN